MGRNEGWYVVWKGEIVGELTDCRRFDMFVDAYTFTPSSVDPVVLRGLPNPNTWVRNGVHFLTRKTRLPALGVCGCAICDDGSVIVRSLYVWPELSWVEELVLRLRWLRREMRAALDVLIPRQTREFFRAQDVSAIVSIPSIRFCLWRRRRPASGNDVRDRESCP
jgi:hypothetical protein